MILKNEATSCDWLYLQTFNIALFSWIDVLALNSTMSHCDFHCELQMGKMNTNVYYISTQGYGCFEALAKKEVLRGRLIYMLLKMLCEHSHLDFSQQCWTEVKEKPFPFKHMKLVEFSTQVQFLSSPLHSRIMMVHKVHTPSVVTMLCFLHQFS